MSDATSTPSTPNGVVAYRLANIEKQLDRLQEMVVTKQQYEVVQSDINELKITIKEAAEGATKAYASKWVEQLVWFALLSGVGGFITALWFIIQHVK